METTLIRDERIAALSLDLPEQARFSAVRAAIGGLAGVDHTKRTGALLEAASAAKKAQDGRVTEARAELGRALSRPTEARSIAEKQGDVNEAARTIPTLAPNLANVPGVRTEMLRREIADRKHSMTVLTEAITRAESLQIERLYFESEAGLAEIAKARTDYAKAREAKELADGLVVKARVVEPVAREADALASRVVALLDHGEKVGLQAGHCPLCDALRSSEEFATAIEATRSKMQGRVAEATRAAVAITQASLALDQAETALAAAEQRLKGLLAREEALSRNTESVVATLARSKIAVSALDLEGMRGLLLRMQEETAQIEQALFM